MELSSSTSLTTVRQVLVAADADPRAAMTGKPGATGSVWQRMRGYLREDGEAHYGRSPRGG